MQSLFGNAAHHELPSPTVKSDDERLNQLAQRYLDDLVLQGKLCDHIYTILYSDLKIQRERIGNFKQGRL
jgi:hypothetical protein